MIIVKPVPEIEIEFDSNNVFISVSHVNAEDNCVDREHMYYPREYIPQLIKFLKDEVPGDL